MIEITPKDLAVRNARGGESYILLCTLRNETELVLDCNIQTSRRRPRGGKSPRGPSA